MIKRSNDVAFLNHLLNHESIKPWVALGVDRLDATTVIASGAIFLATDLGGFLVVPSGRGMYDVHTQFLPEGRGKHALEAAKEALRYMFVQTDALALSTFVTDGNAAARHFTLLNHFVPFQDMQYFGQAGVQYLLTIKQWVTKELDTCQQPSR